nr:hypothetical protein Iba_chr06fCG9240 [Ipomoea batatas]
MISSHNHIQQTTASDGLLEIHPKFSVRIILAAEVLAQVEVVKEVDPNLVGLEGHSGPKRHRRRGPRQRRVAASVCVQGKEEGWRLACVCKARKESGGWRVCPSQGRRGARKTKRKGVQGGRPIGAKWRRGRWVVADAPASH